MSSFASATPLAGGAMDLTGFESRISDAFRQLAILADRLTQPWSIIQVCIILACLAIAHVISQRLEPRIDAWMRGFDDKRPSRMRMILVVARRLRPIIFVLLIGLALFAMRTMTWPSRSFYLGIALNLAAAWVFVTIASRLVRNKLLRFIVTWSVWIFAALTVLGQTERASQVLDGLALNLGEVRISLLLVVKAALMLAVLLTAAGWLSGAISRRVEAINDMSPSMRVLTDKMARLLLFGTAIIIALQSIGFDLTSITVLSGAIGLGLGFGLQKVVSNLVSGVILLVDKSIKPGDVISLGETFGWISSLGARYVSVVTRDGKEYLIPNEDLITGQVVNWSHTNNLVRLDIAFGVSYESDPHQVRKVAREAASNVERVSQSPAPVCHIVGFGDSAIDLLLRFWIHDPSNGITNVRGNVYLALWDALKAAEIDIPFPRRDVRIIETVRHEAAKRLND
ncbi:mechanosensitive ion channel family protein [Tepidamorphus sp. 3E244]|uniref:mechanosensitive ion channel family protein n=1 Tax=Tepidamorphus sp. 3E244 TaxID=3385498 RepID=UPI0038FBF97B